MISPFYFWKTNKTKKNRVGGVSDGIYRFVLKICWVGKMSVILIWVVIWWWYLLVFERRCVFENLALIIKKCVVCTEWFIVYTHTLLVPNWFTCIRVHFFSFLGNSLPFFIFCGWKKQEKTLHTQITQPFYPWGVFFTYFLLSFAR